MWVQLYAQVVRVRPLSRSIFYPQPHVDSSLVTLERRERSDLVAERPAWVRRVIDAGFAQRRKSLLNSLSASLGRDKAGVAAVLHRLGLPAGVRAEDLPPESFVPLAQTLVTPDA